ncbi:hypothetical protein BC374_25575 [Ensifer sp. LC13]|nr:hypothetical protein BC362_26930 [Ensifer sp. LC14]OCP04692.1 hypothetical protein BC374_25575 [Ensifer sp. LC13]OCP30516.1 hypothetical protein BC364_25590 [Ensifer sp. LC499]
MTLPAQARLSTLSREITALTERLTGVGETAVLRSLDAMQTAGMTMPQAIEPKKILAVYLYALSGVPGFGLSTATMKLIRGDYAANPNVLLGAIPKPPVLAALAKAEALNLRAELARKREMVAVLTTVGADNRRSAASRSRVRALLERFRKAHAAEKQEESGLRPDSNTSAAKFTPCICEEGFHAA